MWLRIKDEHFEVSNGKVLGLFINDFEDMVIEPSLEFVINVEDCQYVATPYFMETIVHYDRIVTAYAPGKDYFKNQDMEPKLKPYYLFYLDLHLKLRILCQTATGQVFLEIEN